jgi:hypothetical protein
MTHSIDAPLPPPATTGTGATTPSTSSIPSTTSTSSTSTTDVAKDEARNVGQTAAQAGSQVASTAADQAKEVVHETQRQATDLLQQGRSQLRDQAVGQQQKAAQGLSSIASQLRGMADGTSDGAPGPARDLIQQASGKLEELGNWLQNREPADVLDEVRAYARRKPGTFLLGAAIAGVVAGRLTSGVKAAHTGSGSLLSSGGQHSADSGYGTTSNYVDPTPAYSGYESSTYGQHSTYAGTTGQGPATGTPGYGQTTGTGTPLPPPPYGTVPPEGSAVPPNAATGWDDPARSGGVS